MPIESLPGKPVQYPVANFPAVQPRAVIPTGAYAAEIARALGELAKQLSPEERKKHQLELSLLQSRAREAELGREYQEIALSRFKGHRGVANSYNNLADDLYSGTLKEEGAPSRNIQHDPQPPQEIPDTHPYELNPTLGDLTSGIGPSVIPSPIQVPAAEEEPELPNTADASQLPKLPDLPLP